VTPQEFLARLAAAKRRHGLSVADLAIWFGRSYPTMRCWATATALPREGMVFDECVRRLELLERAECFPVPYAVKQTERHAYLTEAFHAVNRGVFAARSPV
jgi:hypothetical protein